ncbi:MAG: hypothetical protein KDE02_02540, partial [Rhodobacteraceae bacterium]|nr:hypothetical protein [Paracoccaceae bacterium]
LKDDQAQCCGRKLGPAIIKIIPAQGPFHIEFTSDKPKDQIRKEELASDKEDFRRTGVDTLGQTGFLHHEHDFPHNSDLQRRAGRTRPHQLPTQAFLPVLPKVPLYPFRIQT